ncbi:cytochrome P450 [Tengunoibacter tsumagoiensis]|uniref:Putative cytochrome P450 YjiB n=1 Tax=Tengunoibacter tsumagoiensis TaxID=2014871 RepID=A0A402AA78_9CHLR|nr:cytochrome P450 [Tengunoibacter tsumagoiensis]GCE16029.1 putative cytochrome P450 YjiB [Tengunoibacter tsumagoiensis]
MKLPAFVTDLTLPPLEYQCKLRQWSQEMRTSSPIIWDEDSANWIVFRYEDVVRVQSDYATFSSEGTVPGGNGSSIVEMDPPRHKQMRSLITLAFSARTVVEMTPQIEEIVDTLLESLCARDEIDWMSDFANPLPVIVIARMLGLPHEEWPTYKRWTDAIINMTSESEVANLGLREHFARAIDERYRNPGGTDILSRLIAAEVDGKGLEYEDVMGFCFTLLIAGNITTTNVLGNAMLCFDEHPEELTRLQRHPELLPTAVEEILRYMGPFRAGPNGLIEGRIAQTDLRLYDHIVRKGDHVQVNRLSANFDERHFHEPERFDCGRTPNRHQSFGQGIHFCIGAPLARLEIKLALGKLLSKFQHIHILHKEPLRQTPSLLIFGPQRVPLSLQPA